MGNSEDIISGILEYVRSDVEQLIVHEEAYLSSL